MCIEVMPITLHCEIKSFAGLFDTCSMLDSNNRMWHNCSYLSATCDVGTDHGTMPEILASRCHATINSLNTIFLSHCG